MDFTEEDFDYDEDGAETVLYYLIGDRPVIIYNIDSFPYMAETADFDKKEFYRDNKMIMRVEDSNDTVRLTEQEFRDYCLTKGIKPK